ncbi:hypothetical protein ENROMA047B_12130 [Enterobacter rongchengensis]
MTVKMTSTAATMTAWVKFVFIVSILRPALAMGSMKRLVLRSTSINRRMLLHSRASQRRSLRKSRCASRRNSLSISSLLRHSRFISSPFINLCNNLRNSSLLSRYNNNRSSLFTFSLRHSPLRPRT